MSLPAASGFGGVITLAVLASWRYRRVDDARIGELVVRFSSIATVARVAVAAAGLVLAVSLGADKHFRLRPALVAHR
jgi:putative copper export protein